MISRAATKDDSVMSRTKIVMMSAIVASSGLSAAHTQGIGSSLVVITTKDAKGVRPVTCADFHRNDDGSWSNDRPVTLNGALIPGMMTFTRGRKLNDLDVASQLESLCGRKP